MKKGLSVILVIALVASLAGVLGACGGKGENDTTTESTEQTTASPWKDLLEDFTYDYEDESYTERTTDEHYEQEYEALTERLTFLGGQKADLEKAQSDLREVIDELTVRMKEIFASEFARLNGYFGETFREIFGGGNA